MKKAINTVAALFALMFLINDATAQSVAINSTGAAANASAILDVTSTSKGALMPRMTESQRTNISSPATGLLVYQTDGTSGFYYYTGSAWTALSGGGGGSSAAIDLVATKTTTQSISGKDSAIIVFDNVATSPSVGSYDNSTGEYTAGGSGVYLVTASFAYTTSTQMYGKLLLNNNPVAVGGSANASGITDGMMTRGSLSMVLSLSSNDKLKIRVFNNHNSNSYSFTTNGSTRFVITKL